ncbi:hypothetical protein [Flagellimonas pacifica]|uniref:Uncharacterized protein n=1 Tax=Flagellimonas pacifica TaxID=1247520 RepID=A0A285MQN9_9FLAO|nr:hypothetical protein [Allomuricauda parva]SNY99458.1 hypothetical protein SAMN06265377_1264 [Allomuricauda parva]
MDVQKNLEQEIIEKQHLLKYLMFEEINDVHVVSLNDVSGYIILKGYGNTVIEAINDLHSNLI